MAVAPLTDEDLVQLEAGLDVLKPDNLVSLSIEGVKEEFCTLWPKAKPVLAVVAQYIKYIPQVGKAAAQIVAGLIEAGDALSAAVCPTQS